LLITSTVVILVSKLFVKYL